MIIVDCIRGRTIDGNLMPLNLNVASGTEAEAVQFFLSSVRSFATGCGGGLDDVSGRVPSPTNFQYGPP